MKKRLLFALTMMMLMCVAAFSASAVNCNEIGESHAYQKVTVVEATCTTQGYDVMKCTKGTCTSYYHTNIVDPKGHDWAGTYEDHGTYYLNAQVCQRYGCSAAEYEKENGSLVHYYSVEFINGHAMDKKLEKVQVESYGETYDIPVDYAVLAETTKSVGLQTNIVRQGSSITYVGKKPVRTKDVNFGEYRFVGWTKDYRSDNVKPGAVATTGSNTEYQITVSDVTANTKYYAAWEGVEVTHNVTVYNSDGKQFLKTQKVKHGDCIDYPFSYPDRKSETSVDFVFDGWEIGTKTAAGDQYNFYPVDGAHIKHIPIYASDSIKAHHAKSSRVYMVDFLDAYGNSQGVLEVAYGEDIEAKLKEKGIKWGNYTDSTYVYEYKGYWETLQSHKTYLNSFTVPKGSVDFNDSIYLKDTEGNYFIANDGKNLEIEQLHDYENQPGYFNKNVLTYVFPVTEDGEYIINSNGKAYCLVVDKSGIHEIDANGNRFEFDAADAKNLRNVKVKPVYYQRIIDHPFIIEINLPDDELVPEDYKNGLIVQVTNENGQLLASGVTNNWKCSLTVTKAEMYNITVVSPNEKYFGEKGITWSVFQAMKENKANIIIDMEKNPAYKDAHQSRCSCICHNSFFRGIWVRVLNLLYSFFKVKYVCCYDMYATLGDLLAYTK